MRRNADGKVLISRTRINEINWLALKRIAAFLQDRTGTVYSREIMLNNLIEKGVEYWENRMGRNFREEDVE